MAKDSLKTERDNYLEYVDKDGDSVRVNILSTGEMGVTVKPKGMEHWEDAATVVMSNNAAKTFRNMLVNRFPFPA